MYITGSSHIDSQRRTKLTGLFKELPERVTLTLDLNDRSIVQVFPGEKYFGESLKIDDKGRLIIPKWIFEFFPSTNKVLFLSDGKNHYLKFEQQK